MLPAEGEGAAAMWWQWGGEEEVVTQPLVQEVTSGDACRDVARAADPMVSPVAVSRMNPQAKEFFPNAAAPCSGSAAVTDRGPAVWASAPAAGAASEAGLWDALQQIRRLEEGAALALQRAWRRHRPLEAMGAAACGTCLQYEVLGLNNQQAGTLKMAGAVVGSAGLGYDAAFDCRQAPPLVEAPGRSVGSGCIVCEVSGFECQQDSSLEVSFSEVEAVLAELQEASENPRKACEQRHGAAAAGAAPLHEQGAPRAQEQPGGDATDMAPASGDKQQDSPWVRSALAFPCQYRQGWQ